MEITDGYISLKLKKEIATQKRKKFKKQKKRKDHVQKYFGNYQILLIKTMGLDASVLKQHIKKPREGQ